MANDKINVVASDEPTVGPEAPVAATEGAAPEPPTPEAAPLAPAEGEAAPEPGAKADAGEDAEAGDETAAPAIPKKDGAEQRVSQLLGDKRAQQAEIDRLNRLNAELAKGPEASDDGKAPEKPKLEDYEDTGEFIEALTQHVAGEAVTADRAEQNRINAELQTQQREEAERSAYTAKEAAFAAANRDFYDVVMADPTLPISVEMAEAIRTSVNGPAVWYALSQDRAEVERIAALAPLAQIMEMGKMEARIEAQKPPGAPEAPAAPPAGPPAPKTVSTAPPPITPVRGTAGVAPDPEKMSVEEYKAWRKAGGGR